LLPYKKNKKQARCLIFNQYKTTLVNYRKAADHIRVDCTWVLSLGGMAMLVASILQNKGNDVLTISPDATIRNAV